MWGRKASNHHQGHSVFSIHLRPEFTMLDSFALADLLFGNL